MKKQRGQTPRSAGLEVRGVGWHGVRSKVRKKK